MQFMVTLLITICGWSCSSVLRVYMSICTYILLLMTSLHRLGAPLLVRRCTSVPVGGPLPPRPQMQRLAVRSRCRGAHGIRPPCGSAAILHVHCNLFEQHWIAAAIIHIQRSHCSLWSSMVCRIAAAIIHMTCIAHTYHRSLPSQLRRRARREPPVQTCPAERCCEAGRVMQKRLWCLLQLARYIVS